MRILHTADWHLGVSLQGISLAEDHARFLDWLLDVIRDEEVDALLVAGDVFDLHSPSAAAQEQYYGFLARLAALPRRPVAIITAGNHDSPSRLAAPSSLLAALRVHVVGTLGDRAEWADRLLVPLPDAQSPEVVVAALPYVHEYWLGVSPVAVGPAGLAGAMRDAFRGLHETLAQAADARWPGVPRIAMGHLTVRGDTAITSEDYPNPIHQIGTIDALPPSVFGDGWAYVALGHIHRPMPAGTPEIRYAGTPVPVSFPEAAVSRQVRLVELGPEGVAHRGIPVPSWRRLHAIRGGEEEVRAALQTLPEPAALQSLVDVQVEVEGPNPSLRDELAALLTSPEEGGPRLVDVRLVQARREREEEEAELVSLEDLSVEEVFARLVRAERGTQPDETLLVAFRELVELQEDT